MGLNPAYTKRRLHDASGLCQWFAMCDRPAHGNVRHPILGLVPTCKSCADALGLTFEEI